MPTTSGAANCPDSQSPAERERVVRLQKLKRQDAGRQHKKKCHVGAQRKQRAVREVEHFHHADDQHEAERHQRKQQAERNSVQKMRQ